MTMSLYSETGELGQIATNQGYADLYREMELNGEDPFLLQFLRVGATHDPLRLKQACEQMRDKVTGVNKDTLENMIQLLSQAKEVAIVSSC